MNRIVGSLKRILALPNILYNLRVNACFLFDFPHSCLRKFLGLIYFTMQYVGIMFISIPLIFYIDSFIFSRILQQYVKKDEADTDEL